MATTKNTKTPLTPEEIINNYTVTYRGYVIKQKRDFGNGFHLIDGIAINHGLNVLKDGCQAMPGCTWFSSAKEAKEAIDVLEDCGAENFWTELRKRKAIRDAAPQLYAACKIALEYQEQLVTPDPVVITALQIALAGVKPEGN